MVSVTYQLGSALGCCRHVLALTHGTELNLAKTMSQRGPHATNLASQGCSVECSWGVSSGIEVSSMYWLWCCSGWQSVIRDLQIDPEMRSRVVIWRDWGDSQERPHTPPARKSKRHRGGYVTTIIITVLDHVEPIVPFRTRGYVQGDR